MFLDTYCYTANGRVLVRVDGNTTKRWVKRHRDLMGGHWRKISRHSYLAIERRMVIEAVAAEQAALEGQP